MTFKNNVVSEKFKHSADPFDSQQLWLNFIQTIA